MFFRNGPLGLHILERRKDSMPGGGETADASWHTREKLVSSISLI